MGIVRALSEIRRFVTTSSATKEAFCQVPTSLETVPTPFSRIGSHPYRDANSRIEDSRDSQFRSTQLSFRAYSRTRMPRGGIIHFEIFCRMRAAVASSLAAVLNVSMGNLVQRS